jgi:hypothetical protein
MFQRTFNDLTLMWPTRYMVVFLDARTDFPWCEAMAGYVIMCGLAYFLFWSLPNLVTRIKSLFNRHFF